MYDNYGPAIWVPGPDFGFPKQGDRGRHGFPIRYIVIHGTASPGMTLDTWIRVGRMRGGVHFMIGRDGRVVQFVHLSDASWGNGILEPGHESFWDTWKTSDPGLEYYPGTGILNPNLTTISIEHEKLTPHNTEAITPAQQAASFTLIEWLCSQLDIPRRWADHEGGITGHYSLQPHGRWFCPGPYPWQELFAHLNPVSAKPGQSAPGSTAGSPAAATTEGLATYIATHAGNLPDLLAAIRAVA